MSETSEPSNQETPKTFLSVLRENLGQEAFDAIMLNRGVGKGFPFPSMTDDELDRLKFIIGNGAKPIGVPPNQETK